MFNKFITRWKAELSIFQTWVLHISLSFTTVFGAVLALSSQITIPDIYMKICTHGIIASTILATFTKLSSKDESALETPDITK